MNMPIDQDVIEELDTSASSQVDESSQPAVDAADDSEASTSTATAGGGEESDKQSGGSAAKSGKRSDTSEKPTGNLAKALDHLTAKPKKGEETKPGQQPVTKQPEAKTAVKTEVQPKAQAVKKDAAKAVDEPTAAELQAMPERNRKRFETILGERKALKEQVEKVSSEYEAAKPDIERGKIFGEVVKEFGLDAELQHCSDEDVAGAVIFQAALIRLTSGKGTKSDLKQVQKQFINLSTTMEQLGISQAKAPAIDGDAIMKALEKAENDLDFADLRKLVDGLKTAKAPAAQPAQPAVRLVEEKQVQQHAQRQQTDAAPNAADHAYFQNQSVQAIKADGVTDVKAYFDKSVFPQILANLKASYPGRNPAEVFSQLSPQAKHDATVRAHQAIRKQSAAITPAKQKPAPQQRANAAGGSRTAWQTPSRAATTANAAIDHLAGD